MTFLTTRFTDETLRENLRARDTYQIPCLYGLCVAISPKHQEPLYILEMNNTTNELVGIGIITHETRPKIRIYANPFYNRYIYEGTTHIPANEIPHSIREAIEEKCFKGRGHLKRGKSMTQFPPKWLDLAYYEWIEQVTSKSTEYIHSTPSIHSCQTPQKERSFPCALPESEYAPPEST